MALVVHSPSTTLKPLDPTATLQAALTNFENALTTEQRQKFYAHVQTFNQQRPDPSTVVQFVAQIDAENHAKIRTSVSHRLCTFLDAAQQFTSVVDTFVSSNPAIAALLWGGIKFAVLVASNVASYFDKVTRMTLTIGQLCPIYREFSHLYKDSIPLQQALCEYYAVVVNLITKVVEVSHRTFVTGILSSIVSPFESDFGPFQNQLAEASRVVKLQLSLAAKQAAQASAKLIELESVENRQHRRFARKLASEIRAEHGTAQQIRLQESARRTAKTKLYIRDQLSTINHRIPWKQARKQRLAGTADWFVNERAFQEWEAESSTAILWCPGRMGVGKTIFVSAIIDHLHLLLRKSDVISYHFCRPDNSASLLARNILGTLARQLLDLQIEEARGDELQKLRDACQDLGADDVIDLLTPRLQIAKKYYIIIDGLDECEQDQITVLAENLARLWELPGQNIKMLFAGRPELEHQLFRQRKPGHMYRLPLSRSIVQADIERYIDTELDDCLQKNKISLVNPETIWKIKDALHADHDGLFLFVRLFIEEICMLGNESDVLRALGNPPKGINDLLAKRVYRIQAHDLVVDALKILRYCGCTKRPLTVDEFSELLSMSISQTVLDRTRIPQNMDQIIAACCGLIYVEEEEKTVHYVHHSVKLHLFTNPDIVEDGFVEKETDVHLGELCLTYLNFNDFKRQIQKVNHLSNAPVKPVDIGLTAVRDSNKRISEIARVLLRTPRSSRHLTAAELSRKAQDILGEAESSRLKVELQSRPFHLLDYVQSHWIIHAADFDNNSRMWHRFLTYVRGENDLARRPWIQDDGSESRGQTPWDWAMVHNHSALLLYTVVHQFSFLSSTTKGKVFQHAIMVEDRRLVCTIIDHDDCGPDLALHGLYIAACHGRDRFIGLFLNSGADINTFPRGSERNALQAAAGKGHLAVVQQLLAAKADVNAAAADDGGRTALQAAVEEGHPDVVEQLLAAGAKVNAAAASYKGRTALQAAAGRGDLPLVKRLLQAGAYADGFGSQEGGQTALQAAAHGGYLAVVERLLAAGADVNAAVGLYRQTALQAAAEGGHLEVVERLLAAKATVDEDLGASHGMTDPYGLTALQAAVDAGHLAIVELLLAKGARVDVSTAGQYGGRTALQMAAAHGHLAIVDRLLAANADVKVSAVGGRGRTALEAAAQGGHLKMVEQLLVAGATVNATGGGDGRTALQAAAEGGHLEVMKRLLAAGADVNANAITMRTHHDQYAGRPALHAAAEGGYVEVVERLLAAGAFIDAITSYNGRTALQAAAEGGHILVLNRLLANGAVVNINVADAYNSRTALQAAAEGGHILVLEQLLLNGAKVNAAAAYNGRTALQAAAEGGHLEVTERLLRAGADVNAAAADGVSGRTALQAAAAGGHLEVIERLLAAGADVNAVAAEALNGRTALQAAVAEGHTAVIERLMLAGARE